MNAPAVVWKSRKPAQIRLFLSAREAAVERFNEKARAFEAELGHKLTAFRGYDGSRTVTGYVLPSRHAAALPGWRRDGSSNHAVPAKRTPEGKAIAAKLQGLRLGINTPPGMPWNLCTEEDADGRSYSMWPTISRLGDDYYVCLQHVPLARDAAAVDNERWAPFKLSEYHAALESEEQAGAVR